MYHIYAARWRLEGKNLAWLIALPQTQSLERENIFRHFRKRTENILIIAESNGRIIAYGRAIVVLPNNTRITIDEAFLYPRAQRNLLTFKDIRCSGYHITTTTDSGTEYLYITESKGDQMRVVEKALGTSSGLYYTQIEPPQNILQCQPYLKIQNLLRFGMKDLAILY